MTTTDTPTSEPGVASAAERYVIISADTHAGAPYAQYRDYVERRYWADFDEWLASQGGGIAELFGEKTVEQFHAEDSLQAGGQAGAWDHDRRITELEADGIVGDVLFPDGEFDNAPPFGAGLVDRPSFGDVSRHRSYPPELMWAGVRAYNRWLAEFCSQAPERHAGVAILKVDDIDQAVAETRWAKEAGLRGGVLIPSGVGDLPFYNHPRYEPLWATCEELGMPVNVHAAGGGPYYGLEPEAIMCYASEVKWFGHRPFWFLLWGGVFERHPDLRFILVEQTADWAPETLRFLDYLYSGPLFAMIRDSTTVKLTLEPSEYWARQCFIGASFMSPPECDRRHEIGLDKIMWGSDYPHLEGTWPHTRESLRNTFAGVPTHEVRPMLGENATIAYGFDLAKLRPIAERVGPTVEELATPLTEAPQGVISPAWRPREP